MTRFYWSICWQVLARGVQQNYELRVAINTKWSDNPHNNTNQQITQLSIFTQQHIKTIPGSPRTATYLVKLCPNFLPQSI